MAGAASVAPLTPGAGRGEKQNFQPRKPLISAYSTLFKPEVPGLEQDHTCYPSQTIWCRKQTLLKKTENAVRLGLKMQGLCPIMMRLRIRCTRLSVATVGTDSIMEPLLPASAFFPFETPHPYF